MPVLHVDRTDRSRRPRGKPRHGRTRLSFLLRRGLDWRSLLRRRRCPPRTRRVPARRGQPGEVASTLSRFCLVLTHDPQVQSFLITPHAARIALIRASPSSSSLFEQCRILAQFYRTLSLFCILLALSFCLLVRGFTKVCITFYERILWVVWNVFKFHWLSDETRVVRTALVKFDTKLTEVLRVEITRLLR